MKTKMPKKKNGAARLHLPSFADLIDQLTIDQIKEVLKPRGRKAYAEEMQKITHDIDLLIAGSGATMSGRLLRIVIAVAQLNLHVWHMKDMMQIYPRRYSKYLRLAHQLNGVRNRLKNILQKELGNKNKASRKTNYSTDGLKGWDISIR
jgi:hypothetical protein